ncbi:amidohydrolase family protein [Actinomadura sp. 21ATH]|uniref:amidohydrolase family protein n=1 Tax=Actinomadura sp. 21ATH TaxID=1735444 RepID=UPI0035C1C344
MGRDEHAYDTSRRDFLRWLSLAGGAGVAGALPAVLAADARAASPVIVVTGGTLIDGTGAPPRRDATVVLVGDRIAWTGHRREMPAPAGARVVDARGRYVIPGLWDMHTHWTELEKISPPLYLANGVTGIREMWGYAEAREIRRRMDSGEVLGPRMVLAGNIIDGPVSLLGPPAALVRTPDEARAAVREDARNGADFVKIYSYLDRELLDAIAAEARAAGLPLAGHHVYRLGVGEVTGAGMRSFEHLHGMPIPLSSREEEFRRAIAATPLDPADPRAFFRTMRELERRAAATYSPAKARSVYGHWRRAGTWQSPTLTVNRVMTSPPDTYAGDPRLKYIPEALHPVWANAVRLNAPSTPEDVARQAAYFRFQVRLVGEMYEAGVGVLGGTDCGNPYCFPGFGVHDELELLAEAGLTPMQALQTMTRDAARYLGRGGTMGTVTPGKAADLVVLDADPLADIRNTRRVGEVVTRGRLITRAGRERMLAAVEAAAKEPLAAATRLRTPPCGCLPAR